MGKSQTVLHPKAAIEGHLVLVTQANRRAGLDLRTIRGHHRFHHLPLQ
jgi:hypothetical protein